MDENRARVVEASKLAGKKVIYVANVKQKGRISHSIIALITDRSFEIYKKNGTKPVKEYPWSRLVSLDRATSLITLNFGKKNIVLECSESQTMIQAFGDVLSRCLTSSEQEKIGIKKFNFPTIYPTPISVLSRMQEYAKVNKITLDNNFYNIFYENMIFQTPVFNLDQLSEISQTIPMFIDSLPLMKSIRSLLIPRITNVEPYQLLSNFVEQKFFLKHLLLAGEATPFFQTFFNSLKSNRQRLYGLGFLQSNFGTNELNTIADYASFSRIPSIEFHEAIRPDAMLHFYKKFLSPNLLDTLCSLNLSGTPNLDIQLLLPSIKNIMFLSLSQCDVEIAEVFQNIVGFKQLRILNLNGNHCDRVIASIPASLVTLFVEDVQWSDGTLSQFLTRLDGELKLLVSSAQASEQEWHDLFNILPRCRTTRLNGLTWDNNRINTRFFDFLARNEQLQYLSISGCFKKGSDQPVDSFCMYLRNVKSLSTIIMRGSKNKLMNRDDFIKIINAIGKCDPVQFLDITYSKCGDVGLDVLRRMLVNRRNLQQLIFDGSFPDNETTILQILDVAAPIKDLFHLSYPAGDMKRLISNGKLTLAQADQYRAKFKMQPKHSTNSPFDAPFCIYRSYHDNTFPAYLSKKTLSAFKSMPIATNSYSLTGPASPQAKPPNQQLSNQEVQNQQRDHRKISNQKPAKSTINVNIRQKLQFDSDYSDDIPPSPRRTNTLNKISTGRRTLNASEASFDEDSDPIPQYKVKPYANKVPQRQIRSVKRTRKPKILAKQVFEDYDDYNDSSEDVPSPPVKRSISRARPGSSLKRSPSASSRKSMNQEFSRPSSRSSRRRAPSAQSRRPVPTIPMPSWEFPIKVSYIFDEEQFDQIRIQYSIDNLIHSSPRRIKSRK